MLKQIFLVVIGSLFVIAAIFKAPTGTDALVKGWTPPEGSSLSSEANGSNPLGIVIEQSDDAQNSMNGMKQDDYPDLGSEQIFPFVAGLDSYSNY